MRCPRQKRLFSRWEIFDFSVTPPPMGDPCTQQLRGCCDRIRTRRRQLPEAEGRLSAGIHHLCVEIAQAAHPTAEIIPNTVPGRRVRTNQQRVVAQF